MAVPELILIAGPYRSNTDDKLELIKQNQEVMEKAAFEVYKKGHLPILGEWLALPLIHQAGSKKIGDEIFGSIFHQSAIALIQKCDAVLRIGGPSSGADLMVSEGKKSGKKIYYSLDEIVWFVQL